jgi:hypothetical protein
MTRRHRIRTVAALGLGAPLLVGLGLVGCTQAVAEPSASVGREAPAAAAPAAAVAPAAADAPAAEGAAPAEEAATTERTAGGADAEEASDAAPSDVFTTGSKTFDERGQSTLGAEEVAASLQEHAGDPRQGDTARCTEGLDLDAPVAVTRCTVIGWSGEEETYYGYIAPAGVAEADYWLYFSEGAPLPEDAAAALNDGMNGTGAYPVWGEQDEQPTRLDATTAVERANAVLDGFGREDLTVTSVEGEVDLTSTTPVRGTAVEDGSGRTVGITLLPIPTEGEAPAMMVSIDGP